MVHARDAVTASRDRVARVMSAVAIEAETTRHPAVAFCTIAFKALPVVMYATCELVSRDFTRNFIACAVALAVDFWTTKNVSGRVLVGLRYWNEIDESGESTWRFESRDEEGMARVNATERRLFWGALYGGTIAWTALTIGALAAFEFNYAIVTILALAMATTNLVGFVKCSKDQKEQITAFGREAVSRAMFASVSASRI